MATFEERLQRLERLGDDLRQGNLPIDQAMARFEEGVELARTLERDLSKIERRIEILVNQPEHRGAAPALQRFPGMEEEASNPPQEP